MHIRARHPDGHGRVVIGGYSNSARIARSSAWFGTGFCITRLMPSSAAPRSNVGATIAVTIITGKVLPRFRSSDTRSRPSRPGI